MNALPPTSNDDAQHLRLLAIFHYVVGGLTALLACFPPLHVALGLAMVFAPRSFANKPGDEPPPFVGWIFAGMGMGLFLAGITLAVCIILAGRFLARRKRYWFVFVLACLQCAVFPFETVLGVITIAVPSRESVKAQFRAAPRLPAEPAR